ncbi:stage II sporulation protein E [Caldicoprobacter guelmensis]|uniref:stage II sporulation protein E n=1 Tax=Caldicoprobacter guelmensis TaxID=1170224 RepID=UPI00195E0346|nr:stage II sporulation protein E [Caldicoprobacter guelmensis]MBM7582468.1 stage II sporulation protein E [Caldicoprobacter guelmensis]
MQREAYSYQDLSGHAVRRIAVLPVIWKQISYDILICTLCFLMGRAVIFEEVAPFGVALFASVIPRKKNAAVYLVAVILGLLSQGVHLFVLKYMLTACLLFIYSQIPLVRRKKLSVLHVALVVGFALLSVNLTFAYLQGMLFYDLILAGLESVIGMIMVYVFSPVMDLLINIRFRRVLANHELIGTAIFLGLLTVGFWEISLFGISLRNVFAIVLVLLSAYVGGAGIGASIGCMVGLFISMATRLSVEFIGIFAVGGMIAGAFKDLGRAGLSLAFILSNAFMTFYINRSTVTILPFKEIAISSCLLFLVPQRAVGYMRQIWNLGHIREEGSRYTSKLKELTVSRLEEFSHVFHNLAQAFSQISQFDVIKGREGINRLLDAVASKVCTACTFYRNCWQRNFYATYNNMFDLISIIENKGNIRKEDLAEDLCKACFRVDEVVKAMNEVYEAYKFNYRWQQKIEECRNLVAQQLEGISRVITRLAQELDIDVRFKKDLEDAILVELDKRGIHVRNVMVIEKADGRMEVSITQKSCGGRRECTRIVERAVSEVLRRPMLCKTDEGRGCSHPECTLKFVEAQRYKVMTGIARKAREYSDACGDNYSSIPIDQNKYLLVLSDGMGSGSRADAESSIVVSLLENFLEAGFDLNSTIQTINSVLILRSREEIFATADLCVIDLVTGSADFIKIGAVSTFIKKKDGVKVIKAPALPMGILENIQVERVKEALEDGDMIIMMTDGVLDSVEVGLNAEEWMIDVISKLNTSNPQELADHIMNEALKKADGIARDDMTVMVSRVWKPYFS